MLKSNCVCLSSLSGAQLSPMQFPIENLHTPHARPTLPLPARGIILAAVRPFALSSPVRTRSARLKLHHSISRVSLFPHISPHYSSFSLSHSLSLILFLNSPAFRLTYRFVRCLYLNVGLRSQHMSHMQFVHGSLRTTHDVRSFCTGSALLVSGARHYRSRRTCSVRCALWCRLG
jgi:hypothetical protein